ncbi:uncharacterized protein F5147DRAFT_726735 [Suillus discolor]|uniref:Uncharacterized protein n=1 Tax=Suillus discolor TaxID=1912936 RepID=A0A9P7JLW1_9AGAM|nr:uncharacterized protein F5147DRAFT_726735 [Suillus discolor]KAG2088675.1 hypothetical protein F5147DRAFT_726735 [Suillus discolor]
MTTAKSLHSDSSQTRPNSHQNSCLQIMESCKIQTLPRANFLEYRTPRAAGRCGAADMDPAIREARHVCSFKLSFLIMVPGVRSALPREQLLQEAGFSWWLLRSFLISLLKLWSARCVLSNYRGTPYSRSHRNAPSCWNLDTLWNSRGTNCGQIEIDEFCFSSFVSRSPGSYYSSRFERSMFSCSLLKQDMEVVILSAHTPEGIGNYCGSHVDNGLHLPRKKWITALSLALNIFCASLRSSDVSGRPVGILNTTIITQHPICA